jgi:hypothetical protein
VRQATHQHLDRLDGLLVESSGDQDRRLQRKANLDEEGMSAVYFALKRLTAAEDANIVALVKKALCAKDPRVDAYIDRLPALWEPEVTSDIRNRIPALVKGHAQVSRWHARRQSYAHQY